MTLHDDVLVELVRSEPAIEQLFDAALAGRLERRTTVEDLTELVDLTRRRAIALLRRLADAGCGEFKVGRKGHPSRLEWAAAPDVIARSLVGVEAGGDDESKQEAPSEVSFALVADEGQRSLGLGSPPPTSSGSARPGGRRGRAQPPEGPQSIRHRYVLRPELTIDLMLPSDLSAREAEVLADWVRNLSFER